MRKFRATNYRALSAAVGAIALCAALPARAANLLTNPGFEAPTDTTQHNTDVFGWSLQLDTERANFANHTPGGTYSIWMKTFEPAGGGVTQTVGVIPGNTYNLSSYVFFETVYPTTSAQIQLQMTFQDSGGNQIGSPTEFDINPTDNPPTNAWVLENAPAAVAPTGASQAVVFFGWNGGGTVTGQQNVFFDDADLEGVGTVINTSAWAHNGSGDYNASGNWGNGTVPTGVGAEADFFGAITAAHTVFTDVPITVGTINFNNANKYVLAGAGSLTLQVSSGNAQVIVQQGTQEINIPTTVASNTVFNVSSGATLVVADPITLTAGKTITQTGAGFVNYQSIITVQNGASLAFGNSTHAHQLNLATSSTATIGGTASLLVVDSISNSGVIDVNNNAMVVDYGTGFNPTLSIRAQLAQGYNSGHWNGLGIKSTAAANDATKRTGLGYANAGDIGITTLNGQSFDANSVIVKYTYYGDSSLDGKVDLGNDFNLFLRGFLGQGTGWVFGDYNYDGHTNTGDFQLFVDGFKTQGGSLGDLGAVIGASPDLSVSQKASLLSVVPEPATAGIMIVGALVAFGQRRRASRGA
jgi:hypothetical protein